MCEQIMIDNWDSFLAKLKTMQWQKINECPYQGVIMTEISGACENFVLIIKYTNEETSFVKAITTIHHQIRYNETYVTEQLMILYEQFVQWYIENEAQIIEEFETLFCNIFSETFLTI